MTAATLAGLPAPHPWTNAGANGVRFGIVDDPTPDFARTLDFVLRAEDLGFDSTWANDHPMHIYDCWTTLAALAATTTSIRLISMVNCIYYRSPILTARMAADVDRLSGGRLVLGVGVGDDEEEFAEMGIPFPSIGRRQRDLEEALQVIGSLLGTGPASFRGETFSVEGRPLPFPAVQTPHVPILLAGGGVKVTLRQVAKYADACNFGAHAWTGGAFDVEDVRARLDALDGHCDRFGRPRGSVLRTHYSPLVRLGASTAEVDRKRDTARFSPRETIRPFFGTPDEAIAHFGGLMDAGMSYFMVVLQGGDVQTMELLAHEVIPALRARPSLE